MKIKISGYILRRSVAALLFSCVVVALCSAINLPYHPPKFSTPRNNTALGVNRHDSASSVAAPTITDHLNADLSAQDKRAHFGSVWAEELRTKPMTTMVEGMAYTLPNISEGDPPCMDDTW